jgi:NodT family efflux transporter outer membrane factor (OMF) lipoprotein
MGEKSEERKGLSIGPIRLMRLIGPVKKQMEMNMTYLPRLPALGILTATLFLTACVVGPKYVRPPAAAPAAYKEIEGWKTAEPKDHIMRGKWWEIFDDSQLNALEEQIDISNENVAFAEAQFRQARALVQVSRSAYFPTAVIGPSFTRAFQSSSGSPSTTRSLYSLPVDVSWEPDLFGRVRRSVESSSATAQATAAELENVRLAMQSELAQDYFQLRALDTEKRLLDETVAAYAKSLELTRNRYNGGVVSRADVLLADTQLKTTQAQAIDVGVQRAQMEHAIATLVGKAPADFSVPFTLLTGQPPEIPAGLPSELLERRPDIAAAERQMASANAQIGLAMAAFFPTVTLSAGGGFLSTDFGNWLSWPSRFWSIGTALSETLFEGGLRKAQTAQARAAYDATVASYRQTVLTGFQQVEDNLAALRILGQEATAQDGAVKAALDSVAVVQNQYKAGIANYLVVIAAQAAALNNQRTAINILGQRMTAAVLLIKALGGGWSAAELER